MKIGFGLSKAREPEEALQEAFRTSLKALGATSADLIIVSYSYDHGLDPSALGTIFRKVFRQIPHCGASTWGAFSNRESFEAETGMLVMAIKDPDFTFDFVKVHSLREKGEVWAAELARQIGDQSKVAGTSADTLLLFVDSLNFLPGNGFSFLEKHFTQLQIVGLGTSFSVPQSSVVCNGEVYTNALIGISISNSKSVVAMAQNIRPELQAISINRMSENLMIEIDEKPAFYRLCEHLMTVDDLPMMSPDDFRKHMGNLYLIEKPKEGPVSPERAWGQFYKAIPLLGSEMTTGMVAVGQALDFAHDHFLGQKNTLYIEEDLTAACQWLKTKVAAPQLIIMLTSSNHWRDRDRTRSDFGILSEVFPDVPVLGLATNGEYWGGVNQFATLLVALP